jgi:hypothetical protein
MHTLPSQGLKLAPWSALKAKFLQHFGKKVERCVKLLTRAAALPRLLMTSCRPAWDFRSESAMMLLHEKDAVNLNNPDDWYEFHQAVLK